MPTSLHPRTWNSRYGILFKTRLSPLSTDQANRQQAVEESPDQPPHSDPVCAPSSKQSACPHPSEATTVTINHRHGVGQVFEAPEVEQGDSSSSKSQQASFCSPRGFHIPQARFQQARDADEGSPASFWRYNLYERPGDPPEKIKVHYCKNKEVSESVVKRFVGEEVIGFDIEWIAQARATDGIRKNVALIQLATEERIALLHIARYPGGDDLIDLVPPTLKEIMESPSITKVGVAIKADCTRLRNFLGINPRGLFELSYLHKLVSYRAGNIDKVDRRTVRLADQVKEHLGLPILKDDVQVSDWSRDLDYVQTQCMHCC